MQFTISGMMRASQKWLPDWASSGAILGTDCSLSSQEPVLSSLGPRAGAVSRDHEAAACTTVLALESGSCHIRILATGRWEANSRAPVFKKIFPKSHAVLLFILGWLEVSHMAESSCKGGWGT